MTELDKLREMLTDANIPFESYVEVVPDRSFLDCAVSRYGEAGRYLRNQIVYGRTNDIQWKLDGICQFGSYGAKEGLIETYGPLGVDSTKEPMVLTADEVFEIIKKDFEKGGE